MSSSSTTNVRKSGRLRTASKKSQDSQQTSNLQVDSSPESPALKRVKRPATNQNSFKVFMKVFFQKKSLEKLIDDDSDLPETGTQSQTIDILLPDNKNSGRLAVVPEDGKVTHEAMRKAVNNYIQQNPNIMPTNIDEDEDEGYDIRLAIGEQKSIPHMPKATKTYYVLGNALDQMFCLDVTSNLNLLVVMEAHSAEREIIDVVTK